MDRRGDVVLHPLALGALAVWLLNDHVWKAAFPGLLTGKLSDVAGLVFLPLAALALWELATGRIGDRRVVVLACLAFGASIVLPNTWGPAAEGYRALTAALQWPFDAAYATWHGAPLPPLGRGRLTEDPTDALTAVALLAPLWLTRDRAGRLAELTSDRPESGSDARVKPPKREASLRKARGRNEEDQRVSRRPART